MRVLNYLVPWAHKPLGAGSSVLSSKDFRPQLELRHVLIRTDKHVCGFVHKSPRRRTIQQACSKSPAMCGPSLSLNQSSAHPQNHRADMLSRRGIPQGEWRLHPESVRMIWTRYGAAEVDLFATSSRMHIACCSSPCLTPR